MRKNIAFIIILFVLLAAPPARAQDEESLQATEIEGLIEDGLLERAIERIREFLADYPTGPYAEQFSYRLAELQFRTDRFQAAADTLAQFVGNYPASLYINQARYLLASAYQLTRNFSGAKEELGKLLRARGLDENLKVAALERRADIHLQLGDLQDAGSDLEELVRIAPTPERKLRLANTWYERNDLRRAERLYRELFEEGRLEDENRRTVVLRLSLVLFKRNRYADVVELLQPLYDEYRDDDAIVTTLAWSLYRLRRYEEAYRIYSGRSVDRETALAASIREGRSLLMVHEYSAAISFFEKLIAENPPGAELVPAYRGLADANAALGDLAGSAEVLERMAEVVEDDEEQFQVWVEIGDLYLDKMENAGDAVQAYKKALALEPRGAQSDGVAAKLIRAQVALKDLSGAGSSIVSFLADFPGSDYTEEILFLAGEIYERAGDFAKALEHYRQIAQYRSDSPYRARSYEAALALVKRLRRWDDVVAIGTEYLREFPEGGNTAGIHLDISEANYQLEDYSAGIDHLTRVLALSEEGSNTAPILLKIAWGYYKKGDFSQAASYYRQVVERFPQEPEVEEALYWLGWLAQVGSDYENANARFRELLMRFPNSSYAEISSWQLANNYQRTENWQQAAEVLAGILTRFPDGQYAALARRKLVDAYVNLGNYRAALESIKFFAESDPSQRSTPSNMLASGNSLAQAGNLEAALAVFKRLLELYPASEVSDDATLNVGIIYFKMERYRQAAEELKKIPEFFPESENAAAAAYYLGNSLFKLRQYKEAIPQFEFVLEKREGGDGAELIYNLIGQCHENLGQEEEAVSAYRNYLRLRSDPADRLERLIHIASVFLRNGYYDEAIAQLRALKAATTDADSATRIQYMLGEAFESKGDLSLAAEEYLKVTYNAASAPVAALMARMQAGMLYEKLGRFQEAINVYRTIVQNHEKTGFGQVAAIRIATLNKKLTAEQTEEQDEPEEPDSQRR